MAKNGNFSMEFWPIFDIFQRLRQYLSSKQDVLGFHKQATHRRRDEPFFFTLGSTVHDWGWPKNGPFWTKNGQTWQACQRSKVIQKGPKRTKIVNLSVLTILHPFWPIGTLFDYFKQKLIFCSEAPQLNHTLFIWGKKFIFVWNGPKGSGRPIRVQNGQKSLR